MLFSSHGETGIIRLITSIKPVVSQETVLALRPKLFMKAGYAVLNDDCEIDMEKVPVNSVIINAVCLLLETDCDCDKKLILSGGCSLVIRRPLILFSIITVPICSASGSVVLN